MLRKHELRFIGELCIFVGVGDVCFSFDFFADLLFELSFDADLLFELAILGDFCFLFLLDFDRLCDLLFGLDLVNDLFEDFDLELFFFFFSNLLTALSMFNLPVKVKSPLKSSFSF